MSIVGLNKYGNSDCHVKDEDNQVILKFFSFRNFKVQIIDSYQYLGNLNSQLDNLLIQKRRSVFFSSKPVYNIV